MNYLCFPLSNDVYKLTMKWDDSLLRVGSQVRCLSSPLHVHWFLLYFFPTGSLFMRVKSQNNPKGSWGQPGLYKLFSHFKYWWENIKRKEYNYFLSKNSLLLYGLPVYSHRIVNIDFCKQQRNFLPAFSMAVWCNSIDIWISRRFVLHRQNT